MEWRNKGQELDTVYEMMKNNSIKEIMIYGASSQGIFLSENINLFFGSCCKVTAFIDRRAEEIVSVNGIPVYTLDEIEKVRKKEFIVCTVSYYASYEVIVNLVNRGYSEWKDFVIYDKLRDLASLYERDYLKVGLIEIPITEKCSLNCRKCSFFTPYYKNPKHIELVELKKTLDAIFNNINYVETIRFLGGEPFLYPNFKEVLEYLLGEYRDRFTNVHILSNATIIPSDEIVELMKSESRFFVGITDYTKAVDYGKKLSEFVKIMKTNGIAYFVDSDKFWVDLGYPEKKNIVDHETAKKRFFQCAMHCRTAYQQKLWYCAFESSAYRAGIIEALANSDCYDLTSNVNKKELLEYYWGYSETGTNSLCSVCEISEGHIIPVGEQSKKEVKNE